MSPKRLFHIFPTMALGGAQVRLAQIANHFGGRYRHTVFATDGVYDALSLFGAHVPVDKFEASIDKHRGLRNVPLYRRIMSVIAPDAVVTHNWGTIEWAFATRLSPGLKHIHIEDGFGPDEAHGQKPRRIWFRRFALGGARTTVVVPSNVLYDIATKVWKINPARVELIPNGIDLSRFANVDLGEARRLTSKAVGEVLIGTVATLRPEKNLGLLIRAFAKVAGAAPSRLFIVGSGSELETLEAAARAAGVAERVVFFGHTPKPELILRALDIFAMSSDTEQMPIGLLEAMACGLPVAATKVGDIASMVAEENLDFLVNAGDEGALAGALECLVRNTAAAKQVGAKNLAKAAAQYDQQRMFERYAKLFG